MHYLSPTFDRKLPSYDERRSVRSFAYCEIRFAILAFLNIFIISACNNWNVAWIINLRTNGRHTNFKQHLKTYLFIRLYCVTASQSSLRAVDFERRPCSDFGRVTAPYKFSYYLGLPVQHRLAEKACIFCCCTYFFAGTYRWETEHQAPTDTIPTVGPPALLLKYLQTFNPCCPFYYRGAKCPKFWPKFRPQWSSDRCIF